MDGSFSYFQNLGERLSSKPAAAGRHTHPYDRQPDMPELAGRSEPQPVRHDWSGGEFCSCGQDTVICQGCGREVCGDVATWATVSRAGVKPYQGNIGPCCSARFGLGHNG